MLIEFQLITLIENQKACFEHAEELGTKSNHIHREEEEEKRRNNFRVLIFKLSQMHMITDRV